MNLERIIETSLNHAQIYSDYFYFVNGEPESGKMYLDLFFRAGYKDLHRIAAYFCKGFFIDGEYWHIVNRTFSAGKSGNADFGCTLIKAPFTNELLTRLASKKVFVY